METRLTLEMDTLVITRAQEYARQKGRTVSRIVEDYLKSITLRPHVSQIDLSSLPSPITDSITGMFPDDGRAYKTMLDEARSEYFKEKGL